jgi:lipoate-protein ligase A
MSRLHEPEGRTIRLIDAAYDRRPGLDTAIARATLIRGSDGEIGETFRLHVPGRMLAFGKQDVISDGYGDAVEAARVAGFTPVERLAGGRAAAFHEGTLAFSWMIPDEDPRRNIRARYEALSELMVRAFTKLGAPAAVGEVPGEYCPGRYSVHVNGRKVMGVGQRLARRATHVGGVITVTDTALLRRALVPVYAALGLVWDPGTAGALAESIPGLTMAETAEAVFAEVALLGRTVVTDHDPKTVALAESMASEHLSPF